MKFIACGDLHITNQVPQYRKPDYVKHMFNKFRQIYDIAYESNAEMVAVAGDFFDSPRVPYEITNEVMEDIQCGGVLTLVVPGQHDLRYHTQGLKNTPLGTLSQSESITVLPNDQAFRFDDVTFVGAGWNEEPTMQADVVLTHQMVIYKEKLWDDQEDYIKGFDLLKKYSWAKCVISGDNHKPHMLRTKMGRLQINCGSMMRKSKDQMKHRPRVWLVDTKDWNAKAIHLDVLPARKVFDMARIKRDEQSKADREDAQAKADEEMDKFINTLPAKEAEKPKFKNILAHVIKESRADDEVKEIINDVMERVS